MTNYEPTLPEEERQPLHVFTINGKVVKAYQSCGRIFLFTRIGLVYRGMDCDEFVKSLKPKISLH